LFGDPESHGNVTSRTGNVTSAFNPGFPMLMQSDLLWLHSGHKLCDVYDEVFCNAIVKMCSLCW
jgi:hypothetical protein